MVKAYKDGMPRTYQYDKPGSYTVRVAGNLKTAVFSGDLTLNNGLADMLEEVPHIDKNITSLSSSAFAGCTKLTHVELAGTSVSELGDCAFQQCQSMKDVTYGTATQTIGEKCFDGCMELSVASPESYERDKSADELLVQSRLKHLGSSAFSSTSSLKCLAVPAGVEVQDLAESLPFTNAQGLKHIVFMGMESSNAEEFKQAALQTSVFGLSADCMFEDASSSTVYKFKIGETADTSTIEELSASEVFSIVAEDVPEQMSGLQPRHVYKYDPAYVEHCFDSGKSFIVVYIDSKTSARSKMLQLEDGASQLFTSDTSPDAIVFLLDRKGDDSAAWLDAMHYRKTLMDQVSQKQMLVHTTTNAAAVLDFPEASFIGYGGIKFQKLSLAVGDLSAMKVQVSAAAGNVFN